MPGSSPAYDKLTDELLEVFGRAIAHLKPGAGLPELDRLVRAGIAEIGYPGQPSHRSPRHRGARARAAERSSGGWRRDREDMVLAVEPGVYWPGGGGLRVEDNSLITSTGARSSELPRRFPRAYE